MDYPPAAHMLAILGSCADEELLGQAMHYIGVFIQKICTEPEFHIIGPAAASVGKIKDVYKKVIYVKHYEYGCLVSLKNKLEKYIEINSGFRKVYIQFDFS